MKGIKKHYILMVTLLFLAVTGCDKNGNIVLFSIQNDKDLGQQVSNQINNDPNFNLLSRTQNAESYAYLDAMVNEILSSGQVEYRNEFVWDVTIVQDDATLNAFATPGGYIYVYTGLIKFLEQPDDLAGVIGHEIAHADLRHTSRNLQKQYGVSILLSILLGEDPSALQEIAGQIAGTVAGLRFSRDFEQEADAASVEYLADTQYACNGAASFFEKLEASGQTGGTPEFLSTHPSPDSRIADINAKAAEEGCDTSPSGTLTQYQAFQASLP